MKVNQRNQPADVAPAVSDSATMTAVVHDAYGEDDVLRLAGVARPEIGPDSVLVRVHAAGVDRGVWHIMSGLPYPVRLAGYGLRAPKSGRLGSDVAGVVEAVGANVTTLKPGDEVFGVGDGSFAEYVSCRQDQLAPKPAGLTFEQAAAIPVSAATALQGLRDHARVRPGQTVLVIGASGGVGSFAVQIAKALGAKVTGVCSTAKMGAVRSIGADHVIDYTRNSITDGGRRYDVILDIGGNTPLSELRRALTPRGTLIIVGGETDGRVLGGTDRQLRALAMSPFVGQKLGSFIGSVTAKDLAVLSELIGSGQVAPLIDRTFPLTEVPAAIRHVKEGKARGKVVITVRETPALPGS